MKRLFTIAAALLVAVAASAQGIEGLGIIGGLTTNASNIQVANQDFQNGNVNQYHVGVTFKAPIAAGFAIQAGAQYNVKGTKVGSLTGIGDVDFKTGFVEVPVQVQWGIDLAGIVRPYVFAEPFVGYAITNETKTVLLNKESIEKGWDNVKSRLEYGVGLGAGVELLGHFQLSVRYYWNLVDLYGKNPDIQSAISAASDAIKKSQCSGIALSVAIFL